MKNNRAYTAHETNETIQELHTELLNIHGDTGFWEMVGTTDAMQEMCVGLMEGLDVATRLLGTSTSPKALAEVWSYLLSAYQWITVVRSAKIDVMEDIIGKLLVTCAASDNVHA